MAIQYNNNAISTLNEMGNYIKQLDNKTESQLVSENQTQLSYIESSNNSLSTYELPAIIAPNRKKLDDLKFSYNMVRVFGGLNKYKEGNYLHNG